MYYNVINNKFDEDIINNKKFEFYYEKDKEFRIKSKTNEIVYRIVIWLKYYRNENIDFDTIVASFLDDFTLNLSFKELNELKENVEIILKDKFKIKIKSKKPMILESKISFEKLNEIQ